MMGIILPVLQGAGSVALALVAFALSFTWPSLREPIAALRTDRARLLASLGLGLVLALSAALVYVTPGVLLRDPLGMLLAVPVAILWLTGGVALVIRGIVLGGAARGISYALATVAVAGVIAGIVSALVTQHGVTDTVTPIGGFLLALGALAAFSLWARAEEPAPRPLVV
ncbi:hypothetical protein [Leifsonia shinshuensis]|uniref:hypothetical protein n=1 Tax=Leifsonia shinshuensis TaxID=150026 RepID=UPI00286718BB|nr:hypothetical protein [Leifsonia shinshuensis]MDR6972306.1 hypothetical protein [Leifsonia shinshuensis]